MLQVVLKPAESENVILLLSPFYRMPTFRRHKHFLSLHSRNLFQLRFSQESLIRNAVPTRIFRGINLSAFVQCFLKYHKTTDCRLTINKFGYPKSLDGSFVICAGRANKISEPNVKILRQIFIFRRNSRAVLIDRSFVFERGKLDFSTVLVGAGAKLGNF